MNVTVIGAGTMGSGIAQVCAMADHEVRLFDSNADKIPVATDMMRSSLDRIYAKGGLRGDSSQGVLDRIQPMSSIGSACGGADVIFESVVERIEIKHDVFRQIVECAPNDAILATNTSQLSITRIGSPLGDAARRLVGMHFFNPPVLMRLVELVRGLKTDNETVDRAVKFTHGLGKETVVCRKDSPGFMTSRVSAIVRLECLRMVEEGVGTPADIDKALRLGLNFPMGPLELGDFNGLDTYLNVLESLEDAYGGRFRPPVILRNLVAAGRLGRKTGNGIYNYDTEGNRIDETLQVNGQTPHL